jgi:hypothetical protein
MHDKTFDNVEPRITPYDTGKIKIGVYYEPPRPSQDEDEIALQDALLGGKWAPSATAKTRWQTVTLIVGGILTYIFGLSLILR